MSNFYCYVRFIGKGIFTDDKGKRIEYYKVLVEEHREERVSYALFKASGQWAESFADYSSRLNLFFDSYGRVVSHEPL